jgi:hypothetical protein
MSGRDRMTAQSCWKAIGRSAGPTPPGANSEMISGPASHWAGPVGDDLLRPGLRIHICAVQEPGSGDTGGHKCLLEPRHRHVLGVAINHRVIGVQLVDAVDQDR